MREILFRGKRVEGGEWVYGQYQTYSEKGLTDHYVGVSDQGNDPKCVIPETLVCSVRQKT